MMRSTIILTAILIIEGIMHIAYAQEALEQRLNPLDMATLKYMDTYIKITYGRPQKRGRVIFGELVPFGKVWCTGANETAELTTTKDIKLKGRVLKAGTYSLFTIPGADKWTIIFNSDPGQWGVYNYNSDKDVIRLKVPVESSEEVYEPFTIEFELLDERANLLMMWDRTKISIPISFM